MSDLNVYAWLFLIIAFLIFTFIICPAGAIFSYAGEVEAYYKASYIDLVIRGAKCFYTSAFIFLVMFYLFDRGFS